MISVILSTYNDEKTIFNCIKSILNQTYQNFELIIINDCSTDGTKKVIQSFNDKRIVLLENEKNIGRSSSRNKGIAKAKGEFIAIIDGDDMAVPFRLGTQIKYLENNPKIDLVASNVIFFYEDRVLGASKLKLHETNIFNFYLRASEMPHPTWMARANFFNKFKYDPKMDRSEDSDLIFRARLTSNYRLLDDYLVFYRIPEKIDISYKLNQVYLLFLSRIKKIYYQRSFYYFPLILMGLLVSSILYIFGFKNIKMSTTFNSKYQKLFDKLTNNTQKIIVNIISSIKGGGAEIIVNELHKTYLEKNMKSYVIYFKGKNESQNKSHYLLNLNPRNPIGILYLRKILKKIINRTNKEVIIHVHLTWPFFFTTLALMGIKNVKLFFTEHDTTNKRRKIPFFYIIDRLFYSRYLSIICISKGVYNKLAEWVGIEIKKKLKIVYNGSRLYSLSRRKLLKNRLPRIVSIGRLIPKKNFSITINAISEIKNEIESYKIIGEGSERKKLEKLIKSLKLEKKVKLIGWTENVEKYLQEADIQLIPSLYEGFGLVAAEGMSTGLPVVASNIEGLKEVLGKPNPSVVLVSKVHSIDEWKKGIIKVIKNINKLGSKKISKLSEKQVKKFTFKKMAEDYLNVYSKN